MIPLHGSIARVRENFAAQFTRDGLGYLYRRRGRGPAIRVMAEERDELVADFNRGIGLLFWVFVGGAILAFASFEFWPDALALAPGLGAWRRPLVTAAVVIGVLIGWWRLTNLAERRVGHRPPSAPGLARDEQRRLNFAGLGWGVLGAGAATTLALIVATVRQPGPVEWGYVVGGIVGTLFFAVLALVKWRLQRSGEG